MATKKKPIRTLHGDERATFARALRQQYEAGKSLRQIGTDIGASDSYVYVMLVEVGTTMRPTPIAPLGSAERVELAQLMRDGYDAGLTHTALARSIGCDHDTARRLIVEAGGTLRTQVIAGLAEHARPLLAQRLRIEYDNGAGLAELSAELGCRESSVGCLLVEAGATLRPDYKIADAQRYPARPTEGMSVREFADLLGWQPPPPRRKSRPVSPQDAVESVRRYEAGETIQAIADSIGYPSSAIRRTLLAAGVRLRTRASYGPGLTPGDMSGVPGLHWRPIDACPDVVWDFVGTICPSGRGMRRRRADAPSSGVPTVPLSTCCSTGCPGRTFPTRSTLLLRRCSVVTRNGWRQTCSRISANRREPWTACRNACNGIAKTSLTLRVAVTQNLQPALERREVRC